MPGPAALLEEASKSDEEGGEGSEEESVLESLRGKQEGVKHAWVRLTRQICAHLRHGQEEADKRVL